MAGQAAWRVKHDGVCTKCGSQLRRGAEAVWDRQTGRMSCLVCPTESEPIELSPQLGTPQQSPAPNARFDAGIAGGSARREYERRQAKRNIKVRDKWGDRFGRFVLKVTVEPQSIRAWGTGARGEEDLAAALASIPGLRMLHDRGVRGTHGNIDHIVIAPAGVFVVDAKHYEGLIELRNYGWFLRPDWRLTVGRRDQSKLVRDMGWQVEAVTAALVEAGLEPLPPITPVLCFVDGRWPLFRPPKEIDGVLLESERSIVVPLTRSHDLDPTAIDRVTAILAEALPPK